MTGETHLLTLIKNMQPVLNGGQYVFCTLAPDREVATADILLLFKEKEATTLILEKSIADSYGFSYPSVYAWITLLIHSSLEAVGLTAAFANALANENISCNVVAAYYHDHIFVPHHSAEKAVTVLENLSRGI